MFRLCWQGLDKYTNEKKLAKFLQELPLSLVGIYKPPKKSFAFLTFPTQEDYDKMIELASQNTQFKGKKIKLKTTDIMDLKKNRTLEEILKPKERKIYEVAEDYVEQTIRERVMGLAHMPYSDQLKEKRMTVIRALRKFHKKYTKSVGKDEKQLQIIIRDTLPSPVLEFYRNKVEFTIGKDAEGNTNIGFVNGNFRNATARVEDVDTCEIVPRPALEIIPRMKKIINDHNISVRDFMEPIGCLQTLTYRYSERNNSSIVIVEAVEDHPEIRQLLKEEFSDLSICFQIKGGELEVLNGKDYIIETVCEKQFKINAKSFFQTNTSACEVLYGLVRDIVSDADILLDVCCGTGTIGIVCADKVKKVIGLEIIPEAVEDARYNAAQNSVEAEYHVGKAEDSIKDIALEGRVVAVVDPPRAGLHPTILKVLRTTRGLDDVVYVSWNPSTLANDLLFLCHPEGKKYRAPHFVPQYLQPVDLFPHTAHVESVIYLKRITAIHQENENPE